MEEKDFEAKLTKLRHDIDQLDAKIDDKISSLREELTKEILVSQFLEIRDISNIYLDIAGVFNRDVSDACKRARTEIDKTTNEYIELVDEISADESAKNLNKFKKNLNRINRTAGLPEFWVAKE